MSDIADLSADCYCAAIVIGKLNVSFIERAVLIKISNCTMLINVL